MKKLLLILMISIFFVPSISNAKETHYLFNSEGEWVAFKEGKYVFDIEGEWIGWMAWSDADVADTEGKYLGTITHGNRIYFFTNHPYRGNPGYPGRSSYPGRPGYPGHAGYDSPPSGAQNAKIKK